MNTKKYTMVLAASASALCLAANANQVPINGGVGLVLGGFTATGGSGPGGLVAPPSGQITLTSVHGTVSTDPNQTYGDLSVLGGKAVNFNTPISIYRIPPAAPVSDPSGLLFFSVTVGTDTYKFYETSEDSSSGGNIVTSGHGASAISSVSWQITGSGFVEEFNSLSQIIAGGPNDAGTWEFNLGATSSRTHTGESGGATAAFSFTPIPDGGMTAALLGGSLLALSMARRKLNF